jgi:acyl carrier protein
VGEIFVKSRYLARGYWKDPALTREKFLEDSNAGDQRTYRTGDLGRLLTSGGFVHLGRKDSLVKIRGYRIGIGEIELALLDHPGVNDAVVAAWDSEPSEKYLAAYVVSRWKIPPTVTDLLGFLRNRLPHYMLPSVFVFLENIPQANGKVDRCSLPRPKRVRPNLAQSYAAAASAIEKQLVQIWEEVLDLCPIGIHDNFFDLGGHSLAATRIAFQIVKKFNLELPLKSLFESPTIFDMSLVVTEHGARRMGEQAMERTLAELEALTDEEACRLVSDARGRPRD